ncbi:response regulator receiver domain [Photorhabdus laumondii]|uniref:Response receiver domain-containing protein n=1 Tax=Photorhabdus laumondii subsp. clarkei TaxID=2029685 RepID=A0A329VCT8_9GAMM|nr:response regulator receiver domain [Photorhabdus laumondii]RAW87480.1 hypothetical protein CKY01_16975 [Photorhabdus laumondii subsp. clarkei]
MSTFDKYTSYEDLVKASFLEPIRTVTVIDDEYPTFDSLLQNKNDKKSVDIQRLQKVIRLCRNENNNWQLDVYDGQEKGGIPVRHFHQSDLLILDYHLDGNDSEGRCEKTLKIINELSSNLHFNMILVHTNGHSGNLDSIILDIICCLQKAPEIDNLSEIDSKIIDEALDEWMDEDNDIINKLTASLDNFSFLSIIKKYGKDYREYNIYDDVLELNEFKYIYKSKPKEIEIDYLILLGWLFLRKNENMINDGFFSTESATNLEWEKKIETNWIKTDSVFITVVHKRDDVEELPNKLCEALMDWMPHPHYLLLNRLRMILDNKGFSIINKIIDKKYLQAYWLKDILSSDEDILPSKIWTLINNHWEELSYITKEDLSNYTRKMVELINIEELSLKKQFDLDNYDKNKNEILLHVNCFNCSKSVEGQHLVTGHIIKIDNDYWLCTTPACDLVPNRKNDELYKDQPIKIRLMKLYPVDYSNPKKMNKMLEKVNDKRIVFIKELDNDNIIPLGVVSDIYSSNKGPVVEKFYVSNQGKFDDVNTKLILFRTKINPEGIPVSQRIEGKVVAQLRYEYALNYLRSVGEYYSRIGLSYVSC